MKHWKIYTLLLTLVLVSFIAWIYSGKQRFVSSLKGEAEFSTEINLEIYEGKMMLDSAVISKSDFTSWVDSLQPSSGRVSMTFTKCWVPHHRIRFKTDSGESRVEICFSCDEMWTNSMGRRHIPKEWAQSFRELFEAKGIQSSAPTPDEYFQYLERMINETEQ